MKRFRFPLDGLRRVRDQQLREQQIELARRTGERQNARQLRDETRSKLRLTLARAPRGQIVDVTELLAAEREREQLRHDLRSAEEKLAEWALRVEEQRARLLSAHQDVEAVDKLRERRYLEFVREVLREDQKQTDEVAARRVGMREAA